MSVGFAALAFIAGTAVFLFFARSSRCSRALRIGGMACGAAIALAAGACLISAALLLHANR